MQVFFEKINFDKIQDSVIFLDIDGTLTPDNDLQISKQCIKKIEKLKEKNIVYLCTNSRNWYRNERIENLLKTKIINRKYKKPSKKILTDVPSSNKNLVVIGDKFLTDGIFAKNIKAKFICVKRVKSGQERFFIRIVNFIDDVFYQLAKLIKILK